MATTSTAVVSMATTHTPGYFLFVRMSGRGKTLSLLIPVSGLEMVCFVYCKAAVRSTKQRVQCHGGAAAGGL